MLSCTPVIAAGGQTVQAIDVSNFPDAPGELARYTPADAFTPGTLTLRVLPFTHYQVIRISVRD